jgi:hypothetical protein
MRQLFATLLAAACVSYAVSRDAAVATARHEVLRRGLPFSPDCRVKVVDSIAFIEAGPTYPLYVVTFSVYSTRGKKDLYEADIDRRSGRVDDFTDRTKTIR